MGEEGGREGKPRELPQEPYFRCEEVRFTSQRWGAGWMGVVRGGLRQSVSRMGAETDQALKRGALRTQDNYPQPAKWEENSRISQVLQACIFGFVWFGVFVFVFKT